jgi:lysophospholipase L1-like esterase
MNDVNQTCTIAAFGDSITASARIAYKWTDQLQYRLNRHGSFTLVYNFGVAGNTTADALNRIEDLLNIRPDMVTILFGTNDAAIDVWKEVTEPRISLSCFQSNITSMADKIKSIGATPILMTPPPMTMTDELQKLYNKPPYTENGFNFMLDRYADMLRQISQQQSMPLIDLNNEFKKKAESQPDSLMHYLRDGMHPGQAGNELIAELLFQYLFDNGLPQS